MPPSDLHKPLQAKKRRASVSGLPLLAWLLISAGGVVAVLAAVWIALVDDPDGGRPVALAVIEEAPAATGSLASAAASDQGDQLAAPGRQGEAEAAPDMELVAPPARPDAASALPGLVEQSAFGPLPRVAPNGQRPREAYARRSPPAGANVPRIAIVVGGMGLSQTSTQTAIESLPEDITFAFAPYGASLQRWVDKARAEGHEVLLQIPLEPNGYPDEDPGEHTLLVSTDRQATRQVLEWILSRMTSYAGVMNYMGARFTREEQAFLPFLGEIGERGLYYLDDGSSRQSRAAPLGKALQVPVVTADLIVDRDRSAGEIERELTALETVARSRGVAIGVASAFPESVEAIAAWAEAASERGVVLIPASAAVAP